VKPHQHANEGIIHLILGQQAVQTSTEMHQQCLCQSSLEQVCFATFLANKEKKEAPSFQVLGGAPARSGMGRTHATSQLTHLALGQEAA
jgi:hypothetical protein